MKKDKKIIFIVIIILVFIDQISKFIFRNKSWTVPSNNNGYYILVDILIIVMIFRYIFSDNSFIKLGSKIVLSFAIAGALSNIIDRIWKNSVVLIINLGNHIEINLAYVYIIIAWTGMAIIMTKNTMKMVKERKNRTERIHNKNENKNK